MRNIKITLYSVVPTQYKTCTYNRWCQKCIRYVLIFLIVYDIDYIDCIFLCDSYSEIIVNYSIIFIKRYK